jgi:hypothetical protein
MEVIRSSETSVQSTTSTRRHTPEDGILQTSHSLKTGNVFISGIISRTMEFTIGVFKTLTYYSSRKTEGTYEISLQIQGSSKYEECIDQITYASLGLKISDPYFNTLSFGSISIVYHYSKLEIRMR